MSDYLNGYFEGFLWMALGCFPGALIQEYIFGKVLPIASETEESCLWKGAMINIALSPIDALHIIFLNMFFNGAMMSVISATVYGGGVVGAWNSWLRFRTQHKITKWFPGVSLLQIIVLTISTGGVLLICGRLY